MNSYELETQICGPIQHIGMSFYFEPGTKALGREIGLNVVEFYGVGRGGVLGDVEIVEVQRAFWFFHDDAIIGMYGSGRVKIEPIDAAKAHLQAAYVFADEKFGQLDEATLSAFAAAATKVIAAVPAGHYALFDGYRSFEVPTEPVHAAYHATILLRELRGGVHIDTTQEVGLAPNEACFVTNEAIFQLHGYTDADAPADKEKLALQLAEAEELTTKTMAGYLDVLSDAERDAMAAGVAAMADALSAGAAT